MSVWENGTLDTDAIITAAKQKLDDWEDNPRLVVALWELLESDETISQTVETLRAVYFRTPPMHKLSLAVRVCPGGKSSVRGTYVKRRIN